MHMALKQKQLPSSSCQTLLSGLTTDQFHRAAACCQCLLDLLQLCFAERTCHDEHRARRLHMQDMQKQRTTLHVGLRASHMCVTNWQAKQGYMQHSRKQSNRAML